MISPVVLHLRVPKDSNKSPVAMEAIFAGLAELFREHPATISFEIIIKGSFFYFFVVCEGSLVDLVKGQLFSQYPHLEISEVTDYAQSLSVPVFSASLRLEKPDAYPLKTYKELGTDILTNFSGLSASVGKDETVIIQFVISPINSESLAYKFQEFGKGWWRSVLRKNSSVQQMLVEQEYLKLEQPLFRTNIRISAASGKAELLVNSIASLFKILDNTNLNALKLGKKSTKYLVLEKIRLRQLENNNFLLSATELATLYHLPFADAGIAQVAVVKSKTAEPPPNLPLPPEIIPFAVTNFRGNQTPFGIRREDRRKHLYIIGKTGVGKSKLIELLALADIRQGKGCVIMDPHGDLAEELLRYIPRERLYDIIYFNPADTEYPMSFNPLEGVSSFEFRQNVVAGFIAIFKKLFSFTWNQRLEHVLRYTTLALLDIPGSTVLGITKMLSDTKYRQEIVIKIKDPLVKKFWTTEFSSWNDQYAGEAITPIINKVGQFISNPIIRNIVGQSQSSIKLDEIINNEKILIANFSIGKLGEENSALLGAMFITKLWQAAVGRSGLPESERKDTFLYVDEFQNFATGAFANILSEARKYKLNLTIAHQYMAQLPDEVRSTILGNVGSIISFRVGGEDATVLEKEYKPTFVASDFMNLDMRNFYLKMIVDGQTAVPFSGKTIDFPKPDADLLSDVIRISRARWAKPRTEVEKDVAVQVDLVPENSLEGKTQSFNEPLI